MKRSRAAHSLICFVLVLGVLSGLWGGSIAFAAQESDSVSFSPLPNQEEEPPVEEELPELTLGAKYANLRDISGSIFEFEVDVGIDNPGKDAQFFLDATPPSPDWRAEVWAGFYAEDKQVASITLGRFTAREKIRVRIIPETRYLPEPGEYIVTLEVSSTELGIKETIDLTAIVTGIYDFSMFTATGQLNTQARAGQDNHFEILLVNAGSQPIEHITFTSDKPGGWSITFEPDEIDILEPGDRREVNAIITPIEKAIAGDYAITLRAVDEYVADSLQLRVTVVTPTIWGGVGIGIAASVIVGLALLFRRLGRR